MADKPIGQLSEFPTGAEISSTNTLLAAQYSNATYKLNGQRFVNAIATLLDGHGGITSIVYTPPVAPSLVGTMVITLADETTTTVNVNQGKGISSIAKTSTSGLNDTYTITYNDATTSTFVVKNGAKGDTGAAWYMYIQYAAINPTQDSDMSTIPDKWMGIYSGTATSAPSHYTDYTWYEIKGAKGDTGDTGFSPAVTITATTGGHNVTITDETHPSGQTFLVSDGEGSPGVASPLMDGTASAGSSTSFAREDHVHPTDTSRASASDLTSLSGTVTNHTADSAIHVTSTDKSNWNAWNTVTQGTPTLASGVTGNVQVYKCGKVVVISSQDLSNCGAGTSSATAALIFTIPVGYRPNYIMQGVAYDNKHKDSVNIIIETSGDVKLRAGTTRTDSQPRFCVAFFTA